VKRNGFHWKLVVAFIAPVILTVGFTFTHNLIEEDDPVPVSSQAGINFYIGNSPSASGIYYTPIADMDRPEELNRFGARVVAEAARGESMKPSAVSRWWFAEGLKFLRDNPGDAFFLYVRKLRLLTNDYEVALNYDYYFTSTISFFHRVPIPWFALVFALGAMGLIASRGRYGYKGMVLVLFAGLYALSVLVFFVTSRYRMPLVLPLVIFSGFSVSWFVEAIRRKLLLKPIVSALGVIALFAASLWPVTGFSRTLGYADSYYKYAKLYYDGGDTKTAVEYLEKALDKNPEHYQSLNKLGLLYGRAGDYEEAKRYYKTALGVRPDDPIANFNYAMTLYQSGELDVAADYFSTAAELNPEYAIAWRYYAECLVNCGDIETAVIALENAITLVPGDAQARVRLAEIYFDTGEFERARNQAELALKVNDATPGANLVIAKYLFVHGRFDEGMSFLSTEQRISGNTAAVLLTYTETLLIMGYPEDAVDYYEAYLMGGGQPIPRFESIR
jgi:tetratricopeptide (TPR) repeat protein